MSRKKPETSPARSGSARPARPAPARSAPRPAERQPERPAPAASPAGLAPGDVLDLIASDPSQIDEGLSVFEDSDGRSGLDYDTDVGRIDLLARDRSGALVVFMVVESDVKSLIGELLERIGWVRTHLAADAQEVRGVILLSELPDNLGYAASALADTIELKLYRLALSFETVAI